MRRFNFFIAILLVMVLVTDCKNDDEIIEEILNITYVDRFSSVDEFRDALIAMDTIIVDHNIPAFLDTLPNGYPNTDGEVFPLTDHIAMILGLIEMNDITAAVAGVYGFDGLPFSLISYLYKAQLAEAISAQLFMDIMSLMGLPPIAVAHFNPPQKPVVKPQPAVCPCDPKVKILVTWVYRAACGNLTNGLAGYAAGNELNNMSQGHFRLDGVVKGCDGGGKWTNTIAAIGFTSYGALTHKGNQSVLLYGNSPGTFNVTFTYTCDCNIQCGRGDTKTFKLNFQ